MGSSLVDYYTRQHFPSGGANAIVKDGVVRAGIARGIALRL